MPKHIRVMNGVRGTKYHAIVGSSGTTHRKTFDTMEQAQAFVDENKRNAKQIKFDFPLDVIDVLFDNEFHVDRQYIENHFEENLKLVFETLQEREVRIFSWYYVDGLTLEAIGLRENITRERVRQIVNKTVRKIRYKERLKMLRYGKEYLELCDDIGKLNAQLMQVKLQLIEKITNPETIEISNDEVISYFTIESLDLSVRSFNCLKRVGINTLGELMNQTIEDLLKIRNMGRKSLREIITKLEEKGLMLKDFRKGEYVIGGIRL
jgi:RNA polymerase sigma factor (sigma-70 family)